MAWDFHHGDARLLAIRGQNHWGIQELRSFGAGSLRGLAGGGVGHLGLGIWGSLLGVFVIITFPLSKPLDMLRGAVGMICCWLPSWRLFLAFTPDLSPAWVPCFLPTLFR